MTKGIKNSLVLKERKFLVFFLIWMSGITYLSLFPVPEVETAGFNFIDKIVHFFIYLTTILLGFLAFKEILGAQSNHKLILRRILFFAIGYGLLIELLQHVMPFGRMAEIWDVIANTLGALTGYWLIQKYGSLIRPLK